MSRAERNQPANPNNAPSQQYQNVADTSVLGTSVNDINDTIQITLPTTTMMSPTAIPLNHHRQMLTAAMGNSSSTSQPTSNSQNQNQNTEAHPQESFDPEANKLLSVLAEFSVLAAVFSLVSFLMIEFELTYLASAGTLIMYHIGLIVYKMRKITKDTSLTPDDKRKLRDDVIEILAILLIEGGFIAINELWPTFYRGILLIPYTLLFFFLCFRAETEDAENSVVFLGNCLRIFLILQAALIFLKLDNLLGTWDWKVILFPAWVTLIVLVFYSIGVLAIFLCVLCYFFEEDPDKYQLRGLLFMFINFTSLAVFIGFLTIGGVTYVMDNDIELIKWGFLAMVGFSLLNLLITCWQWRILTVFIFRMMNEEDMVDEIELSSIRQRKGKKVKKVQQQKTSLPLFLEKMSSSYFRIIKTDTDMKNVLERARTKLTGRGSAATPGKGGSGNLPSRSSRTQAMRDAIQISSSRLTTHQQMNVSPPKKRPETVRSKNNQQIIVDPETKEPRFMMQKNDITLTDNMKKNIIANSPRGIIQSPAKTEQTNGGATCCICFDSEPDAVFLECGHGGLCLSCALDIWQRSNECFLCRNEIAMVVQIDLKALEGKVVKAKTCTKLVSTYQTPREDEE